MAKKAAHKSKGPKTDLSAEVLLLSAGDILQKTGSSAILIYANSLPSIEKIKYLSGTVPVFIVTTEPGLDISAFPGIKDKIVIPPFSFARLDQIKVAVVIGLARGVIETGQRIVYLSGIAGSGKLDTLMVLEIGTEFEVFGGRATELFSLE